MVSHYYENIFVDILDALHFDLILEEGSPIPSSFFSVIFLHFTPCVYSLFLATSRMRGADECCPV